MKNETVKKPAKGKASTVDDFDEENAEIGYDIISEDQLEAEHNFAEGEYGIPDDCVEK
jgi:hypothetical protein